MSKKIVIGIASAVALLLLIWDNQTAICGASEGVDLCIRSVIPSLFPFLYLSGIITATLSTAVSDANVNTCRRTLILIGYLGGYPVGAQSVAQAYRIKRIPSQEVKRLLICCNNPGPSFIFGIAAYAFDEKWIMWVLWSLHIGSSLMVYKLIPQNNDSYNSRYTQYNTVQSSLFMGTIKNMAQICGWIILFRVLISILESHCFGWFPNECQIAICGLLELTNGCIRLREIDCLGLRFCLCVTFLTFGGLCTLIQTHSVADGLDTGHYLLGKALEGCCSFILAYVVQFCLFSGKNRYCAPIPVLGVIMSIVVIFSRIIRKGKISGRNLCEIGV